MSHDRFLFEVLLVVVLVGVAAPVTSSSAGVIRGGLNAPSFL